MPSPSRVARTLALTALTALVLAVPASATTQNGITPLAPKAGTSVPSDQVRNGPRTGVAGDGGAHPWRFWIANDPTVSPYRAHVPRRRSS